jgi:methionine biosynthesis protein MetW
MDKKYFKRLKYYARRFSEVYNYIFAEYDPKISRMNYDDYWITRGSFIFSTRYAVFAQVIEENSSVLDLGCGDGATLKFLLEQKNIKGEGVDISEEAVKMARNRGIEAFVADVASAQFQITKEYDYIIISELLEHIVNPEDLMEKVKHRFKKALIVSIPNIGHYLHVLRLLFGRFPAQYWTLKDFSKWVTDLGFKIVGIRTHTGFLFLYKYMPNLFADTAVFLLKDKE